MKKAIIYLVLVAIPLMAQSQLPDSLQRIYDTAKSPIYKGRILGYYAFKTKGTTADKLKILLNNLSYFTKKKDKAGIAYTQFYIANSFLPTGDLSFSLKYAIEALQEFEQFKDTVFLLDTYDLIGNSFNGSNNHEEALTYWKKSLPIAHTFDIPIYSTILNNMADCYNQMNLPDSALPFIQEAVAIDRKSKDTVSLASSLSTLGETYIAMKNYEVAKAFIRESLVFSKMNEQTQAADYGYNDMAQIYFETSHFDSALIYAKEGLSYAYPDYLLDAMRSYELIYKTFDKENKTDSSNRYFRLVIEVKDSILSDEKNKNIQSMNFQEQVREQEAENQQRELALQHQQNIENALIALGVITFIILFLLLSRNVITNSNVIRFLGVVALLLVFEFINLLVHPYIEELTNHSQILMLLLLVCLAAVLVPLHHKLEHLAINKMLEKNKKMRLANAKKTIKKLESKDEDSENGKKK